jgi:hypothetical protein
VQKTNSRTIPRNTWKVYSYNIWNWLCTVPAHDHHVHLHTQSHLHMHTTKAPSNAINKDQGKRRNSRHELKTAQITIPGGGLPAQYTQYLHTLTTSGETRTWNLSRQTSTSGLSIVSRVDVRVQWHPRENLRTCLRGHTRIVERDSGTLVSNYVRVYRAHENHRTCTVAPPRESTNEYLDTSVPNAREAQWYWMKQRRRGTAKDSLIV